MSAAADKGRQLENLVVEAARLWYPDADRQPKRGAKDIGDILLPGEKRLVIECKSRGKSTKPVLNLPEWHREAQVEAEHKGVPVGVVVFKRYGNARPAQQWAALPLGDLFYLLNDLSVPVL